MLIVFELHVRPDFDPNVFLSEGAQKETEARVLTRAEAENVGLSGMPDREGDVRYVLVNARHRHWIERAIDADPQVTGFDVHDVG